MIILFAQGKGEEALFVLLPMFCFIILEVVLIVGMSGFQIYYLLIQYQALNAVSKENREMEPAMIFLVFIPFFGTVWYFISVLRIARSLEREFADRGLPSEGDFGQQLGITAGILDLTCCLMPIGLGCHFVHLRRLAAYTKTLEASKQARW